MGFKTRAGSDKTYANVARGFIVVKAREGDKYEDIKAKSREIESGKHEGDTVWELNFPCYEGHIENVYIKESEGNWGNQLIFDLIDKSADEDAKFKKIQIQVNVDSSYAARFIRCCRNIDLKQPVEFSPYCLDRRDDPTKKTSGWTLFQDEVKLEFTIPDEDLPEVTAKKDKRTGKTIYEGSVERLEFLLNHFEKWLKKVKLGPYKPKDDEEEKPKKKFKDVSSDDDGEEVPKNSKKKVVEKEDDDDDDEPVVKKSSKKKPSNDDDDEDYN